VHELLGTIPQWLTALGIGSFLIALLRRDVQVRGLRNTDQADIRDHYAQEVAALRDQLLTMEQHYRNMLEQSDKRHDECEVARSQMRAELDGLKRQMAAASADRLLVLEERTCPSDVAPHSTAAAKRIKGSEDEG
jgi:hypothetical protein